MPGVDLKTFLGHISNLLTRSGYPIRDFEEQPFTGDPARLGEAQPGGVSFAPETRAGLLRLAGRYGKRGRVDQRDIEAGRVGIHELLHQMRYGRTPEVYEASGDFEEGGTEAATQDMLPIMMLKLFGTKMGGVNSMDRDDPAYLDQTTDVRHMSRFGSGSPNSRTHDARAWRRQFLHADAAEREQMAGAARAAAERWRAKRKVGHGQQPAE